MLRNLSVCLAQILFCICFELLALSTPGLAQTNYTLSVHACCGLGTITSSPAGIAINCSPTCVDVAAPFSAGTTVTLTATPANGYTFKAWDGACTGSASKCSVTLDANRPGAGVTAEFAPSVNQVLSLSVSDTGGGSGTVISSPSGINCSGTCTSGAVTVLINTTVTLTAAPASGSTFQGWGGACSGTTTCQVYVNGPKSVSATFAGSIHHESAVYSTAQSDSQSFLRFYNSGPNAGTVTVILADYTSGKTLAQWTSPAIAPGSAPQFAIGTIESGAGASFVKPNYYSVSVQTQMGGTFQHVLWHISDGTLTNLSTCEAGVTAIPTRLTNVHSSVLDNGYPSTIVVNNTGSSPIVVLLDVIDAASGSKLGTYATDTIPANAQAVIPVDTIEAGAGISPSAGTFHYVIQAEATFTGYLQHLVNNQHAGVITDMTTVCPLSATPAATASIPLHDGAVFSTTQTDSQSFLRFFNSGASSGTVSVTLSDFASGTALAQWTSPSIAPGTAPQFSIGTIESGASRAFTKPSFYSVCIKPQITGTFQHVLWHASDGTLTNLSTCDSGVGTVSTRLANVHSSLIGNAGYPSAVVIYNTGTAAAAATVNIYNATSGVLMGTYTTASIPPNAMVYPAVADIEAAANISAAAAATSPHYVMTLANTFTGYMQHVVHNQQAGVDTDMTTICALPVTTSSCSAATAAVYGLTVSVAGSGAVSSSPAGITCGSTCSASYATGASVSLTQVASVGSYFQGWSGACSGTGACTVTMNSNQSVGASFSTYTGTPPAGSTATLTLNASTGPGTASGTISINPSGQCQSGCNAILPSGGPTKTVFPVNTRVTLTANPIGIPGPDPQPKVAFTGWQGSGGCTGTGTCTLVMNSDKSAIATFSVTPPINGTWSGSYTRTASGDFGCTYHDSGSLNMTLSASSGSTSFTGSGVSLSGLDVRSSGGCSALYTDSSSGGTASGTTSGGPTSAYYGSGGGIPVTVQLAFTVPYARLSEVKTWTVTGLLSADSTGNLMLSGNFIDNGATGSFLLTKQ